MTLTTALFVGGESRRMGADKVTLLVKGEPLWQRQLRTLESLAPEKILISARSHPAWSPPGINTICDAPPSRGPLSGLAALLKSITTTHLLALAVDLPCMSPVFLRALWASAKPGCGVSPVTDSQLEPLCAIYPAEASTIASELLTGENVSLKCFAQTLKKRRMLHFVETERDDWPLFQNINTPDDLAAMFQNQSLPSTPPGVQSTPHNSGKNGGLFPKKSMDSVSGCDNVFDLLDRLPR